LPRNKKLKTQLFKFLKIVQMNVKVMTKIIKLWGGGDCLSVYFKWVTLFSYSSSFEARSR
jgi:hypothetical protein